MDKMIPKPLLLYCSDLMTCHQKEHNYPRGCGGCGQ